MVAQADINFQPYLQSIAVTYEKWWECYTLTDAESQQRQAQVSAPIFDFGLMVQTMPKQEPKQEHEQHQPAKVERFSVLDGLRKYALGEKPEHVLLVGRPGSGIAPHLPHLLTLIPIKSGNDAYRVILASQASCKYYNYSIQTTQPQPSSPSSALGTTIHAEIVQIIENNHGTVTGKSP